MRTMIAILCFCMLAATSFAQQRTGTEDEKASNAKLTATLLINKVKEKIGRLTPGPNLIEQEISGNPGVHQKREASRQASREMMEKHFSDWFQTEAKKVIDQIDDKRSGGTGSYFSEQERGKLLATPQAEIGQNLDRSLDPSFDEARKQAVSKQYSRLTVDVYPTEEEVDNNSPEKLREILNERAVAKQSEPVFEENKDSIASGVVGPIVADAYKQLADQSNAVSQATGNEEVLPDLIGKCIADQLAKEADALAKAKAGQTGGPTKVYGTFPSVNTKVPEKAKSLAVEKLANGLSQMAIAAKQSDVKEIMLKDLSKHLDPDESRTVLERLYHESVIKTALDTYVKRVPQDKQAALNDFVKDCAENSPECKSVLENLVKRSLAEVFGPARAEIADEQLKEFFGPLADGSWKPEVAEIDGLAELPFVAPPDPIKLKGAASKAVDETKLLAETKKLAAEKAKSLLDEGLTAWHQQMTTVGTVEKELEQMLTKYQELPAEDEFIKQFGENVEADWKEQPLAKKYPALFEKVVKESNVRAKALLPRETKRREDMTKAEEERKAEEQKREAEKGEEETGGGDKEGKGNNDSSSPGGMPGGSPGPGGKGVTPPQPKPKWVPDMIIDLDMNEKGQVSAEIYLQGDTPGQIDSITIPIIGDASPETMNKVKALFLRMLSERQKDKYFVYMRVFSRHISYGTIADFRDCLKEMVDQFKISDRKFGVSWFDELMKEKKEKGNTDIDERLQYRGQTFVQVT